MSSDKVRDELPTQGPDDLRSQQEATSPATTVMGGEHAAMETDSVADTATEHLSPLPHAPTPQDVAEATIQFQVLAATNPPWDELIAAGERDFERNGAGEEKDSELNKEPPPRVEREPSEQPQAPRHLSPEPIVRKEKATGWLVGEAAEGRKERLVECCFCSGRHYLSIGDIKSGIEACPCVRFLKEVWSGAFHYLRGANPACHRKDLPKAALALSSPARDRVSHPEWTDVVIFPDEDLLRAWLRFEYGLLQKGDTRVVGQPHRLLCYQLPSFGLGLGSEGWEDHLLREVEREYRRVNGYGPMRLLKYAAELAFHGYKVIPPQGKPGLFPRNSQLRGNMHSRPLVKPAPAFGVASRLPALQNRRRAMPY